MQILKILKMWLSDIFNVKYQTLKNKELIEMEAFKRKNPGEIIVIL